MTDKERIEELEAAIRKHRDESVDHEQCWLNDEELWSVLNDGDTKYQHDRVPPCDEFLNNCIIYWRSRNKEK